jgi:hypothetical protein
MLSLKAWIGWHKSCKEFYSRPMDAASCMIQQFISLHVQGCSSKKRSIWISSKCPFPYNFQKLSSTTNRSLANSLHRRTPDPPGYVCTDNFMRCSINTRSDTSSVLIWAPPPPPPTPSKFVLCVTDGLSLAMRKRWSPWC